MMQLVHRIFPRKHAKHPHNNKISRKWHNLNTKRGQVKTLQFQKQRQYNNGHQLITPSVHKSKTPTSFHLIPYYHNLSSEQFMQRKALEDKKPHTRLPTIRNIYAKLLLID